MKYDSFDNIVTVVTGKSKNTSMKSAACTVKVNGKDVKVEISVNQDGQWSINLIENKGNSTTPAATSGSLKLER